MARSTYEVSFWFVRHRSAFRVRAPVIAAMEASHPHLTTQKSFYVEISRACGRAELVTDDAKALRGGGFRVAFGPKSPGRGGTAEGHETKAAASLEGGASND